MNELSSPITLLQNGLVRVPSKKLFRKWKQAELVLFDNRLECILPKKPLQKIFFNPSMKLSNVFQQKNGSLIEGLHPDDHVFFCRLVNEIVDDAGVGDQNKRKSNIGSSSFLDDNETENVLKFGSKDFDQLVKFAKALDERLTSSVTWDNFGRHFAGSEDGSDNLGRQYRSGSKSIMSPMMSIKSFSPISTIRKSFKEKEDESRSIGEKLNNPLFLAEKSSITEWGSKKNDSRLRTNTGSAPAQSPWSSFDSNQ